MLGAQSSQSCADMGNRTSAVTPRNLSADVLVYRSVGPATDKLAALATADLGALYAAHQPSPVRTAWMMTGSKDEAEDIVLDAFVRFASGPCRSPEHPLAYLRRGMFADVR